MGIAKYFKDYDINPKYDLTFLFTTAEEYGFRGAWHYHHSHPTDEYEIIRFIGLDQLGFKQMVFGPDDPTFTLEVACHNVDETDIMNATVNLSRYRDKSGYEFNSHYQGDGAGNTDDVAFIERGIDTIQLSKGGQWHRHHRSGIDHTEGDSMKYMDRDDVNATFNLTWDIVKYFTVDPDCWLGASSMNIVDSDDNDDLVDTVRHDPSVISTLPHDYAMINLSLMCLSMLNDVVKSECINFTIDRSSTSKTINITLPESESPGYYVTKLELFNSTGWVDEIVNPANPGASANPNANVTVFSGMFFLYPYNYNKSAPNITNVCDSPDPVGFGYNVTISANVTSDVNTSIDTVTVKVTYPDDSLSNFTMSNTENDTYEYVFNDTWQNGEYEYGIWAKDSNGNESGSPVESFNVSAQATISVCTIKDSYSNNESVNLTDPPGQGGGLQQIGYELLDNGEVLRIWNKYDNYYFNTSNGIQFSNHYNEYWSHNVLMLGYYNNDVWNLIYRTDELSGFNKDIDSDGETFVNATLWKDLSYGGYDFRLAVRYHLGVDDNELTVIPYIKNLDTEDIPYNLGFAWEINDIQIDMTPEDDYIEINGTSYYLDQELDEIYNNMANPCFYIREDKTDTGSESLYLRWDEDLNDIVRVKSRTGEYNAPVTLGIKIGTLTVDQEKYTELFWHDASEVVYYFDDYDVGEAWIVNPGYMVDNNTSNYASTAIIGDVELCNNNTCNGIYLGLISKVEIRAFGYWSGLEQRDIILRPVFKEGDGNNHYFTPPRDVGDWSQWFEITYDKTPAFWNWGDVSTLDCDVESGYSMLSSEVYCSKVEIRVTYTPNQAPIVYNPVPSSGSTGVSIQPVLSISVSDTDGDTMNITWLSNSSGSWQAFGTNLNVSDGTYQQNFTNASVNGQWWYWKVNVSDGLNYTESSVYSFYTGNESKIKNIGSTNIMGYLLMQVQFYNNSSSSWVVALDTVNETSPGIIDASGQLGLDTVFNGLVNTSSLSGFGNGTYRVYAAFRDPSGNVLVCDDDSELVATYEFTITFD